jgi:hypothetical protein
MVFGSGLEDSCEAYSEPARKADNHVERALCSDSTLAASFASGREDKAGRELDG